MPNLPSFARLDLDRDDSPSHYTIIRYRPLVTAVDVRPYRENDQESVVGLWREVFPRAPAHNQPHRDVARKLEVQPELFLIAVERGEVVGTVMAGDDGHRGWLHLVAVRPDARRQGVGRRLIEEAERRLAAGGCLKVNLQVRAGNCAAIEFWERLGYGREERVSFGKRLRDEAGERASFSEEGVAT